MPLNQNNSVWSLIQDLSNKKGITEIAINSPKQVFVEREGKFIQLNVQLSKHDMYGFIKDVSNYNKKICDADHPILDGNLPDGSRINAIIEPFVAGAPAITIRKYIKTIQSFDTSPGIFGLYAKWIEFFKAAVASRLNIIVSGGTGVGKTTFLNLLLQEIGHEERIVTIEDTLELSFKLPNMVRLEAAKKAQASTQNVTIRDLVKNALRMRPDRIIIGEVRGGELFDLFQAMNTGHDGSMSSVHASSTAECLSRMETLFLLSGQEMPIHVVRKQMASAVDIIIQVARNREGRRVITQITEVTGMEGENILIQTLAEYNPEDGGLKSNGLASANMNKLHTEAGLPKDFFS
jgi:pilus assembly protein CpaF